MLKLFLKPLGCDLRKPKTLKSCADDNYFIGIKCY